MTQAQMRLSLSTTTDHFDLVHARSSKQLVVWTPGRDPQWHVVPAEHARSTLASLNGQPNVFVTPNQFHGWRLVRLLAKLDSMYVDIDIDRDSNWTPTERAENALSTLARARLPCPSCMVFSGRGVHLYWLFEPVPAQALPRWQACQRRLQKLLNSDPAAVDCTRVLRVIGSTNPKAEVHCQTVVGEQLLHKRYEFDWLCDQILPHERAVVRDLSVQRARRQKAHSCERAERQRVGIYGWWALVYRDLVQIMDYHWFGGVPAGHRDQLLFLSAVALAWFCTGDALQQEIAATARQWMPTLTDKQVDSYTSSVVDRAVRSTNGERVMWQGQQRDPRYWFKRDTLWSWLGELVPDELVPKLRAIVPAEVIKARRLSRERERDRQQEGRYQSCRKEPSIKEQALGLRRQGTSIRDIAVTCGVSKSTVSDWLRTPNTDERLSDFARLT